MKWEESENLDQVLQDFADLLTGPSRVVVISDGHVDLASPGGNLRAITMKMVEGSLAAGGRGAGFGERRVTKVALFMKSEGVWTKPFETNDEAKAREFEVPYYVSRLPMTLPDGSEFVGYGVVDPELLDEYSKKLK